MKSLTVTKYKRASILTIIIITGLSVIIGCSLASTTDLEIPIQITTYGEAWDGILAFGLFQYDPDDIWTEQHDYLIIMDTEGTIHYIRDTNPKSYNIVNLIEPGSILFNGEPRNSLNILNTTTGKISLLPQKLGHHDAKYDSDTGNILTLQKHIVTIEDMKYEHDRLVEIDPEGNILWSWTTADYFSHELACEYSVVNKNSLDLTHCNSIDWDKENNVAYVNIRNLNTFCKIDTTTGEQIWSLGEHGDFELFNKNGDPVSSLWYHAHSVEQVEPNVFLMFDNDLHNKTDFDNRRSRILEVTINENNMTAWASWVWTAPREKFSGYWGDADRLPNGNRLGVFGTQHHDLEGSSGAYLVEITPEGDIVREYDFQRGYGMYRCEIIDPSDLLRPQYFEEYYTRYTQDHVTLIYPSASPEKARGCEPASYSDWNAASILYTGLDDVNEVLDTNAFIVNQTTGAPLLESGSPLITIGGPIVNPVVAYYESDDTPAYDRAPVKCAIYEDRIEYQKRDGTPIAGLSLDEANMNTDYFLIEIFMDGRGRTAYICYGLGWKGTLASGKYFVREFETLMESESSWIVVQWTNTNMNDFVNGPGDGDTYTVIASG